MSNGVISPAALAVPAAQPAQLAASGTAASTSVNQNGKREASPTRSAPPAKAIKSSSGTDAKTASKVTTKAPETKPVLPPMGRGTGIDMRAEEDAQRRYARSNVGNLKFSGASSRARHTDLFGEQALRTRLAKMAQQHKMTVDDEAMRYLALAAEIRVRTLLTSAIRAQQHRATATHTAKPAMTKAHGDRPAQALWSQKITSDPHAVMIALTNANREENKAHRVARTERNARETEIARAVAAQRERDGVAADTGSSTAAAAEAGSSAADPANQGSPSVPLPKKPTKGKKNREISADVQAKLTNAVASKGRKKYAWETSGGSFRPPVPSLLSGNRKKKEEEKKKKEEEEAAAAAAAAAKAIEPPKPKRPKRTVSAPHRRRVDIDDVGDKKGHDDKTLTVVDMAFALEHDGGERGAGTTEDIVRRLWTRPGGPYGT